MMGQQGAHLRQHLIVAEVAHGDRAELARGSTRAAAGAHRLDDVGRVLLFPADRVEGANRGALAAHLASM